MITDISLKNFKCFQHLTSFKFSRLNLLTGINGRGKSSLLQSILLLSQTARLGDRFDQFVINGELVELGSYNDIKNSETPRSEDIFLNVKFDAPFVSGFDLQFYEDPEEPLKAKCRSIGIGIDADSTGQKSYSELLSVFVSTIKRVHFVGADRLGPVKYVDKTSLPEFVHVGSKGQYSINILANSINLPNVSESLYLGKDSKSLLQQTVEWMSYILEGATIDIRGKESESSVLYMLLNNKNNSYGYKPTNVGFGYSYVLPLIVTGLISRPGEVIIVENPEAHLHPRAQSRIAHFFARVASSGVQVFVESHSEHILNGMRVSVLNRDIALSHNDLTIHYFNESFDSTALEMNSYGKINNWPLGFFDQQELDLAEMFKYNRIP